MKKIITATICGTILLGAAPAAQANSFLRQLLVHTVVHATVHTGINAVRNNNRIRRSQTAAQGDYAWMNNTAVAAPSKRRKYTRKVQQTAAPQVVYNVQSVYDAQTYSRLVNGSSAAY